MAETGFKRIRRRVVRATGAFLGSGLVWGSTRALRLRVLDDDRRRELEARVGGVIYAFWHGRFWLLAGRLGHTGTAVLVSLSEDGEVIARVAGRLGFHVVRGSSSRGGSEGLRDLERCLASGRSVALTPDGPRGPARKAQVGAIVLARRTGRPIVPIGAAARPAWEMRSWDRFQVAKPGARAVICYQDPLWIPAAETNDIQPLCARLESALNDAQARADREVAS